MTSSIREAKLMSSVQLDGKSSTEVAIFSVHYWLVSVDPVSISKLKLTSILSKWTPLWRWLFHEAYIACVPAGPVFKVNSQEGKDIWFS